MKSWPAIASQLLAVAILSMAAVAASGWASLYCYFFGSPLLGWLYEAKLAVLQASPAEPEIGTLQEFSLRGSLINHIAVSGLTVIWGLGLAAYVLWVRRSLVGLLLTALPVAAFAYFSWMQLLYAYPVCNSF